MLEMNQCLKEENKSLEEWKKLKGKKKERKKERTL